MRRAWYSKQAERYGTFIYRGVDGSEVECTVVGDENDTEHASYKWPDKEDRGLVTAFIRKGKPNTADSPESQRLDALLRELLGIKEPQ